MCNVTISNAARLYETRTAGSGNSYSQVV